MTDKDIQEAIDNCFWRKDVCGAYVCSGDLVPCGKHIYDGKCPTLIELYAKEATNYDKERTNPSKY